MSSSITAQNPKKVSNKYTVLKQSVGLDMSKDKAMSCFSQQQSDKPFRILSSRNFDNTSVGFEQLHQWIDKQRIADVPLHILMEATGVYYESLAYFLRSKGYRVTVILPNKAKNYAKSLDYKSKTDAIDAKILAQMSLERHLQEWVPPSDTMLKIKRLSRERTEVLEEKTVAKNRLHAKSFSYSPQPKSLQRAQELIDFLDQQIEDIEKDISDTIDKDADIKQRIENVCSISGVGLITAAAIVGETNGFTLFESKAQLVSYAGYDVVKNESGDTVKKPTKISKKGNRHIRRALHFPAICAVKYNSLFKNLFDRVLANSKIKMKAYVAVQRKLLVLIYTLYKNNIPFDPKFNQQNEPHCVHEENCRQENIPAYSA